MMVEQTGEVLLVCWIVNKQGIIMANWAYTENNEVVGQYDILPKNWQNISGLNLAINNLSFLKSVGWYPVTKDHESFDNSIYYISGYEYELRENDVLETIVLTEKEPEHVPDFSTLKYQFIEELRIIRNQKLLESDWTQLVDVQNLFDETTKNQWVIYRQNLRDITEEYSENEVVDINNVNWPSLEN
jgi:hypothetical protein